MKLALRLIFILSLSVNFSFGQDKLFTVKEFKWTFSIPKECSLIESEDWLKDINKENSKNGYKLENEENSKIVVVLKIDSLNYFVVYSSINLEKSNALFNFNKFMYHMYSKGIKNESNFNKVSEKFMINNIEFNAMKIDYNLPDGSFVNTVMYGAFIKKNKIFTSFLIYNDPEKGKLLINTIKESTFK